MDSVANTAGTYYAYIKTMSRKATKPFIFHLIAPTQGNLFCNSLLCDANLLVKELSSDILYLDPPYNERNYQRYYHLPENIARRCIPKPFADI
jgi:adenine-specific DNA-methyltransferase